LQHEGSISIRYLALFLYHIEMAVGIAYSMAPDKTAFGSAFSLAAMVNYNNFNQLDSSEIERRVWNVK
jgi:hypothetical protein